MASFNVFQRADADLLQWIEAEGQSLHVPAGTTLIRDEASSALDADTEQRVIANLARRGCTQIIVAHRLSTIRDADLILVMEQGQVIQRGTHAQLVQDADGPYAQLLSEVS